MRDKKRTYKRGGLSDECQTPAYALEPLSPYLIDFDESHVYPVLFWDCCDSGGLLYKGLVNLGLSASRSGINFEQDDYRYFDFLEGHVDDYMGDCAIVTNPPFSTRRKFFEKCIDLDVPFALLMRSETDSLKWFIEALDKIKVMRQFGVIKFAPRVNFYMPNKGWKGGGSHFPVSWFTYRLGVYGVEYVYMKHWNRFYCETFEVEPENRRAFSYDDQGSDK